MSNCVIGLDIGTTSTIALLIRLPDQVLAMASRPVTLHSIKPGWAEEDPRQWWQNVGELCQQLLADGGIDADQVAALGVAGMLPAVVLLGADGELLRPSIQQSDGRCGEQVEQLRAEHDESVFLARAGNGINQQLVSAKLRWLEQYEPEVFARIETVFGAYDYINWRLTGVRAIEQNWALEAGFVDVATHELDAELIALSHLPREAIPAKVASHEIMGRLHAEGAAHTGLRIGTPVIGGAADMVASAYGAGVNQAGDVLLKFGGAIDILTATDHVRPDRRLYLDYHLIPGLFMPNGCMATGGSALNWFARNFAGQYMPAAEAAGVSLHRYLDGLAAERAARAEGVSILPYFLGEKTPIHDPAARGVIHGLTLSHDAGHVWRALLEAYGYAIAHHLETLRDMGHRTERCIVSDGGAHSTVWMQIVADILQQPLQCLTGHPGSCLGVAWVAAIGAGLTDDWAGVKAFVSLGAAVQPNPALAEVYEQGYRAYRKLYADLSPFVVERGA